MYRADGHRASRSDQLDRLKAAQVARLVFVVCRGDAVPSQRGAGRRWAGRGPQEAARAQVLVDAGPVDPEAKRELHELPSNWLNSPEWVKDEVVVCPDAADNAWPRHLPDPMRLFFCQSVRPKRR
jgi:hypothetical protein